MPFRALGSVPLPALRLPGQFGLILGLSAALPKIHSAQQGRPEIAGNRFMPPQANEGDNQEQTLGQLQSISAEIADNDGSESDDSQHDRGEGKDKFHIRERRRVFLENIRHEYENRAEYESKGDIHARPG